MGSVLYVYYTKKYQLVEFDNIIALIFSVLVEVCRRVAKGTPKDYS